MQDKGSLQSVFEIFHLKNIFTLLLCAAVQTCFFIASETAATHLAGRGSVLGMGLVVQTVEE